MSELIALAGRRHAQCVQRGSGPALLYLHGAFGLEWSHALIEQLARSHRVIAPHLPGYGESDGLEGINTFHDLSVWLDELLDALDLASVAVVGHDFGGAAAAEYAALFRRRVERLALIAPYGLWPAGEPLPDIFGLTPGALTRLLYADPTGAHAEAFNAPLPDKAQQDAAVLRRRQALIAAAKLLWPIPDKGLRHRLYRVIAPTLLIGGRHDRLMDAAYIADFASRIAQARAVSLEAGHMIPQEAAQTAAAEITAFLQSAA
jgi:pimeloyl-ACP methyl ester carboxylesterase